MKPVLNNAFNMDASATSAFAKIDLDRVDDDIDDLAAQVILEQWFRENFIDNVN